LLRTAHSESATAGFTLVEALVALAVATLVLSAIAQLIGTSMRGVHSVEQHAELVAAARRIEAGLPDRQNLAPGGLSGEQAGYRWRLDVLPYTGGGVAMDPRSRWMPQTLLITVSSPSGATLRIDTVRLIRTSAR